MFTGQRLNEANKYIYAKVLVRIEIIASQYVPCWKKPSKPHGQTLKPIQIKRIENCEMHKETRE